MKTSIVMNKKLAFGALTVATIALGAAAAIAHASKAAGMDNVAMARAALETSSMAMEAMESAAEWHESKISGPNLFAMLKAKRPVSPAELCEAIEGLSVQRLAHFDAEIRNNEYFELVEPCHERIVTKLDYFWAVQAEMTAAMNPVPVAAGNVDLYAGSIKIPNEAGFKYPHKSYPLKDGQFALTFDDGPSTENTEKVLEILRRYNAKSTFFLVGRRVDAPGGSAIVKKIAADGHSIGNHSYTHSGFKGMLKAKGAGEVKREIETTQKTIFKILGWVDPFFRFPGGTDNQRLLDLTKSWRLSVFHWHLDSKDFETPDSNEVVRKTVALMAKKRSGIFLFHDVQKQTMIALPHILEWMAKQNFKVVTLVPEKMSERTEQPLVK